MPEWLLFTIGVALTIGTGFFVASEFSLVNLDRADLEGRQARGERGLGLIIAALRRTSTHLSSAQLGITLTTLVAGFTLEPALSHWIDPVLVSWGLGDGAVQAVGSIAALLIATVLSMIVGELVPQFLAFSEPLGAARVVVPFQVVFTAIFRPIVWLLNATAGAILRIFRIEQKEELSGARSAEELVALVRRSASEGGLEQDTATLITRTLRFSEHTAGDVMTPRPRLETVDRGGTAADVIELARRTGHSRFPVEDGSPDEIVGVVHVKQAVAVPRERRREVPVAAIATDAHRVPETMRLDTLLGQLRAEGYQMAIVVDEYGGTAGVATLEDLIEELVGEVSDEHDRRRAGVVRSRGGVVFPGMLRPDEMLELVGVTIPDDGPYETVGGWIMSELGRIPVAGDEIETKDGAFRVVRLDGRRVDRVRFTASGASPRGLGSLGDRRDGEG